MKDTQGSRAIMLIATSLVTVLALSIISIAFMNIKSTQKKHNTEQQNSSDITEHTEKVSQSVQLYTQEKVGQTLCRPTWKQYLADEYYDSLTEFGSHAHNILVQTLQNNTALQFNKSDDRQKIVNIFKEQFHNESTKKRFNLFMNVCNDKLTHCIIKDNDINVMEAICARAILQFQESNIDNLSDHISLMLHRWFMSTYFYDAFIYCTQHKLRAYYKHKKKMREKSNNTHNGPSADKKRTDEPQDKESHKGENKAHKNKKHKDTQKHKNAKLEKYMYLYIASDKLIDKILGEKVNFKTDREVFTLLKQEIQTVVSKHEHKKNVKQKIKKVSKTAKGVYSYLFHLYTYVSLEGDINNSRTSSQIWCLIHKVDDVIYEHTNK